jgi:hypothetical protein
MDTVQADAWAPGFGSAVTRGVEAITAAVYWTLASHPGLLRRLGPRQMVECNSTRRGGLTGGSSRWTRIPLFGLGAAMSACVTLGGWYLATST